MEPKKNKKWWEQNWKEELEGNHSGNIFIDDYTNLKYAWDDINLTSKSLKTTIEALKNMNEKPKSENFEDFLRNEEAYDFLDCMIIFYGFGGMLANKFSVIQKTEVEKVRSSIAYMVDAHISVSFKTMKEFGDVYDRYYDTIKFEEISLQDALQKIRMGELKAEAPFIDADVDAFDDNCTEECLPGAHKCGK